LQGGGRLIIKIVAQNFPTETRKNHEKSQYLIPGEIRLENIKNLSTEYCGYTNLLDARPAYVGFVVDKMTLGPVFLPVRQFSLLRIIPPMLHKYSLIITDVV
jgi:hypothetical protein